MNVYIYQLSVWLIKVWKFKLTSDLCDWLKYESLYLPVICVIDKSLQSRPGYFRRSWPDLSGLQQLKCSNTTSLTKCSKRQVDSKLVRLLPRFRKYLSMEWNISVQANFCRIVADSYLKKLCNTVRYTLENTLALRFSQ